MKRSKYTVSVAIIAYNEEKSIRRILRSICTQNEANFTISHIVVVSDGSSDKTVTYALSVPDPRIVVREDGKRKGKAQRINEVFESEESDIVVILDADIVLANRTTITRLVTPLIIDSNISFTSGKAVPRIPKTITQKIVHIGILFLWEIKRFLPAENVYSCSGAIRAFKKTFYKKFNFPSIAAEDVFPYFYAIKHVYGFRVVSEAVAYYGIPATYSDYRRQMNRYLSASTEIESLFGKKMTNAQFTVPFIIKFYAAAAVFIKSPIWTIAYLACLFVPKARALLRFSEDSGVWETVQTSKI